MSPPPPFRDERLFFLGGGGIACMKHLRRMIPSILPCDISVYKAFFEPGTKEKSDPERP